ncbi:MAG: hypothetical protein WC149_06975 [Arcobacteraceae bacterium]
MIQQNLNTQIEQATACSSEKRKQLVNWFSKQNIEVQIDIFREQRNQFFKLKEKIESNDVLILSSFFLAILNFYRQDRQLKGKNKSQNINSLVNISNFSIKKHKKVKIKEKREKLLNLWSVIQKLKSEEYSFRSIAQYIRQRHRFEVSHTYIIQIWKELENEF